jgi:hypothetical protein
MLSVQPLYPSSHLDLSRRAAERHALLAALKDAPPAGVPGQRERTRIGRRLLTAIAAWRLPRSIEDPR